MDIATCLEAHINKESDEFDTCSSDSDSKSVLDEDYYRNLPPPIPGETLLSLSIPVDKSAMQETRLKSTSYSDILKSSPQAKSLASISTNKKKKKNKNKNGTISKETKNESKPKDNLNHVLSNLSLNEQQYQLSTSIRNRMEQLVDPEYISKLVYNEVTRQMDQLKLEYELVPKVKKKSVQSVPKENSIKTPLKPQNNTVENSECSLVERKTIKKISNYIDNAEKCMSVVARNHDLSQEKTDNSNRIPYILECLRYAQVALKKIQE